MRGDRPGKRLEPIASEHGARLRPLQERHEPLRQQYVAAPVPARVEYLVVFVLLLDYTKGISRRLLAYEQLLLKHPELCEHVRMVQVAVPSGPRHRWSPGAARRWMRW